MADDKPIRDHIRNPLEWSVDQLEAARHTMREASHHLRSQDAAEGAIHPEIRRIEVSDLGDVLAKGLSDFGAYRTDVIFLCIIYPLAGLVLARLIFGYDMLPLVFPLASGFALIGPVAAVGLYEMSRRREMGVDISWADAFGVVKAPTFGTIVVLGLILLAIFLVWLATAYMIYALTLGPEPPTSISGFARDVLTTGPGWAMIIIGFGVGFLFAVMVLTLSVVSFPLLLDHDVGLDVAIGTSVRAVLTNPVPMAAWGLIVAGGLVLGSLPALLGLILVMPVLGHATWHLYRKVVIS
ncbi:MAG TPA: DUF2189 domain-containing protein [Geminicoccaceae bacterium]|nr:DUF2189 domain-containing protein [Geminicoccaceae bacterium]